MRIHARKSPNAIANFHHRVLRKSGNVLQREPINRRHVSAKKKYSQPGALGRCESLAGGGGASFESSA